MKKYAILIKYTVTADDLDKAEALAKIINDNPLALTELEFTETKDIVQIK